MSIKTIIVACAIAWSMLITNVIGCRSFDPIDKQESRFRVNASATIQACKGIGHLAYPDNVAYCSVAANGNPTRFYEQWTSRTGIFTEIDCGGILRRLADDVWVAAA
ncbi:hypothetical protein SeMB42_g07557 [Synchytrium endobioticum]|uniref:Uncharacterized protein n=1 Tax=Synchytrium endobioticum TaxID=286115 RepID=A0A507D3K4_9FUNG|nr:hypothetical protein SeMB42_g07557 [Synchytrium endobioticum]TPX46053.1 hypothetical protein SeLEV6574_g03470 [Synchytrium endobioticum]